MSPLNADPGLFLQPDLRRKRISVSLSQASDQHFQIIVEELQYSVDANAAAQTIDLPAFKTWAPETPVLYTVLRNEAPVGRFGMREFTIKDQRFHLNNRPIVLRGVLIDSPEQLTAAWLASVKKTGFNFIRMQGIPAPEDFLDAADEIGILVCDAVDASDTDALKAHIVARRNHPCIVMWDVAAQYDDAASRVSAMRAVQSLDPSRVIVCGLQVGHSPIQCLRPYHDELLPMDAIAAHLPSPSTARGERFYENVGNPHQSSMLVSFGAPGSPICDPANAAAVESVLASRELTAFFPTAEALSKAIEATRLETLKAQTQAVRVNPKLGGYSIDASTAAASAAFTPVQTPIVLALRAARTNLVPREEVPVVVTIVNDERIEPLADLSLQVVGPTNQVLWKKKRSVKVPKQTREVWTGTVSASGSAGMHRFVVRLMQGMKMLSQNSIDLHVVEPLTQSEVEVQVLDPHREWTDRCMPFCRATGAKPRVYVVPPLANTIRAYSEVDFLNLLAEVRAGAVGLIFSPPRDWNDLADRIDTSLRATSVPAINAHHCIRLHPVFDGLPARCIMRHPYRNVAPRVAFTEESDESICGAIGFDEGAATWGEDILVRQFGAGRLVFTHMRILEHLGTDPVADRLFVNLLRHFGRRSVPSDDPAALPQSVLDWLRRERAERPKQWSLIGPFANWDNAGHDTVYPPEQNVDLAAVHAGWRDAVRWTRWYALGEVIQELSLDDALALPFAGDATTLPETFYAYAECNAPARQAATIRINTRAGVKIFANGASCGEFPALEGESKQEIVAPLTIKQGKNTILIKVSRMGAPAHLKFELTSATRDPLIVKWWR
ncbi:MAG TPA: glycoside hydrolase family 2 TIM barrel-domain containing protein [Candidatus Hydrogenedentes bacterium]|nr:glycoside hydrolase family 2 TIM barrel-domain containing protein [Candidatus Hydrogenedentota bacterium]